MPARAPQRVHRRGGGARFNGAARAEPGMAVRAAARRCAVHRPLARARTHGAHAVARRGRHCGGRVGAGMLAAAAIALVAGAGVYMVERGSPGRDISHAWKQFRTKGNPEGGTSRLDRLGSNRYDFWRVAWDGFTGAPLNGIGTDNFREA